MNETKTPAHDCGMCDGPLVFDGVQLGQGFTPTDTVPYDTWICSHCGYWHISKDCCDD